MAAPAILKIDIIADATKAAAALDKTGKAADKTGSRWKGMAGALAGGVAAGAVLSFGKSAISAAQDSQRATSRLEAVYKSMGDTTGDAAKAAENYAGSLSKKTAVDDEQIMAGQALLATFGNVSSEVARQAGIFDRATAAGADLAAAGFGTIEGNAKQLGKALQDPVKGVTALAKAGVTFTAAQKKQIAAMVKSGDLLGAQKIVMGEVEHQVKGTAEATASSTDKMNLAWGETQESVGNALLPVLNTLAPILSEIAGFIQENTSWLIPLAAAIAVVVAAQWAWNAAMAANPLTLIVIGIALVIAAIVLLVKNWDRVKAAFVWVFEWVKANWPLLLAILTGPIGIAVLLIVRNWDTIKGAAVGAFNAIKGAAVTAWEWVRDQFQKLVDFFAKIPGWIGDAFTTLADVITSPFRSAFNAIANLWNSTVGALSFKVPGWVPGIGGKGFDVPDIPTLATGGTVLRTGLAVVHAGERFSGVSAGRAMGASASTVVNIHVHTDGLGASNPQIQRGVANALRAYTRRNGPLDIAVKGTR
jgi:hypothetical protein